MARRIFRAGLRVIVELIILVAGSMLVGFAIGTVQHYIAFGVRGDGFSNEAFQFATLEGGTLGLVFGIPTGLIVFYAILRRHVDSRIVAYTVGGSLVGGCCLGLVFYWPSAALTPVLTMAIAAWLKHRNAPSGSVAAE